MDIAKDSEFYKHYNVTQFELHGSYLFGDYPMVVVNSGQDLQIADMDTILTIILPYHEEKARIAAQGGEKVPTTANGPKSPLKVDEKDVLGKKAVEAKKKAAKEAAK